ncbi:hypothetical protein RHSIM_Rhsim04G0089500 [Rhododendron simsii]|uniref:Uncharacterized protein n=1 Tax=Rhododendron simsii TaxID=118357 RepID=A0A834GZN0_RHOSS|nr:hypothetical protein RHSIM_Rhsim04G0089500 [Rhododendron simsii]
MLSYVKLSIAVLFCCLITKVSCQKCTPENLNVLEERSNSSIKGQPKWLVTVTNKCSCTRTGIVLDCKDFRTTKTVDTSLLLPTRDGRCLLKRGQPVKPDEAVKFSYAWRSPIDFYPRGFKVNQGC